MRAGTLILWDNYPDQRDGQIKPRYFIYLGKVDNYPIMANLTYITTQKQYYEEYGDRCSHSILRAAEGRFNLPKDSIIDFDMLVSHDHATFDEDDNISALYEFTDQEIRSILWEKVKSSKISKIVKRDIREAFSFIGVTGLRL